MRLWSPHPRSLDRRALGAVWREGLLARKVLLGQTKGYRKHSQLIRFRECADPLAAIDAYLHVVQQEATRRKVTERDPDWLPEITGRVHPIFELHEGPIASWERT